MFKNIVLSIAIPIIFGLILSSCQGPAGPAGRDGIGINYSSIFFSVNENQWRQDNDISTWYFNLNVNTITNRVIDEGFVLFYVATTSSNENIWSPLPQSNTFTDSEGVTYSQEIIPWFGRGNIQIQYVDSHPTNPFPPIGYDFKVIVADAPFYLTNLPMSPSLEEVERILRPEQMTIIDLKSPRID